MSLLVSELETPALLVDLDVLERNVAEMAEVARRTGVKLRPHTKTHKCPPLARRQVEAGASGITCAKLGEAEVMADAGLDDILIAYPIWGRAKLRRLRELLARCRVLVSLDSIEVAEGLAAVGRESGTDVEILAEVDTGLGRCGRPPGRPTVELVKDLSGLRGVRVVGLLTHAGHAYRSASEAERRSIALREGLDLVETAERCEREGISIREISVGSTPTARDAETVPGVTEIRPGTYVFNDAAMIRLGVATTASVAARILVTVVSRPAGERFVVDGGTKCFTSDGMGSVPDWIVVDGRPDLHMEFLTEEHGVGRCSGEGLAIGDRLEMIPSHICSAVNMFDVAFGVRDGKVVEELPIAGRGKVW